MAAEGNSRSEGDSRSEQAAEGNTRSGQVAEGDSRSKQATADHSRSRTGAERHYRGRRILVATALAVVVLLLTILTLAAGALFWAGSESGIRFLIARLEGPLANAGQELRIDDPVGSLWDELRLPRVSWRGDGIEVSAEDLSLRWSPRALLQRRLQVAEVSASRVTVRLPPPSADPPPARSATMPGLFGLPGVVQFDRIAVGELQLVPGAQPSQPAGQPSTQPAGQLPPPPAGQPLPEPITIREIAAGVGYADGRFRVSDLGATTRWGRLQEANAEFGDAPPHPLRIDAIVRGEVERIAYDLALAASGDLEKAVASVDGRAANAVVRVEADLVPLATMPLASARVALDGLDLARLMMPGEGSAGHTSPDPAAAMRTGTNSGSAKTDGAKTDGAKTDSKRRQTGRRQTGRRQTGRRQTVRRQTVRRQTVRTASRGRRNCRTHGSRPDCSLRHGSRRRQPRRPPGTDG